MPVLRVDDSVSLFELNAIAEYLDETVAPRLHPNDPVERAVNRARTDYVPTFAETVTGAAYADTEADYNKSVAKITDPFERLEQALQKQGNGPLFNGNSTHWLMPPTRRFCSGISSSTGSRGSGKSKNFRGSMHGPRH